MAYNYKPFFSKISIQGKGQDELSYVFSNGPIEHKNGSATLFGIFAVHSSQELYQYFIKQTVKHFVDFYNRAASLTDNPEGSENSMNTEEFLFENAIQYVYDKVTTALIEFQEEHKRLGTIDLKKINCILGALTENALYLNATGGMLRSFYIYPLKNKQGFSRYSLTPILDIERGLEHQMRLFSQIVSGAVSLPGGVVCVTTSSLLDYISLEQLKQLVTTQQPEDITRTLNQMLSRINARNDITALFIHPTHTGSSHTSREYATQTAANRSMEELNSRQRGTDSVMTPETSFHISHAFKIISRYSTLFFKKLISIEKIFFQPATTKKFKTAFGYVRAILTQTAKNISDATLKIYTLLRSRSYRTSIQSYASLAKTLCSKYIRVYHSIKKSFLKIPKPSRIILSLSLLFIALFFISLFTLSAQKKKQQHFASIDAIIQALAEKSNTAEARIIFENDSAALPLIHEMRQIIEHIPNPRTEKQRASVAQIQEKISALEERLNHAITITAPDHIATLTGIPSIEASIGFTEYNGTIFITAEQSLYTILPSQNFVTPLKFPQALPSSHCASAAKNSLLVCNADGTQLYRIEQNGTAKILSLTLSPKEVAIDRIQLYNSNAYVYSSYASTFFKHLSSGQGYTTGVEWVKDKNIPLNDISDFDIDGSIFVLKGNNELYQYINGKPRQLPLPSVLPGIKTATKVETDSASPFIFLMDPAEKRIIVIDKKTLQLKVQFFSPVFTALKDIQLRPSTKSLLVLNNADIYSIPFEKIK